MGFKCLIKVNSLSLSNVNTQIAFARSKVFAVGEFLWKTNRSHGTNIDQEVLKFRFPKIFII